MDCSRVGDTMKVSLSGDTQEKHTLKFKGDDKIEVDITEPRPTRLIFIRK